MFSTSPVNTESSYIFLIILGGAVDPIFINLCSTRYFLTSDKFLFLRRLCSFCIFFRVSLFLISTPTTFPCFPNLNLFVIVFLNLFLIFVARFDDDDDVELFILFSRFSPFSPFSSFSSLPSPEIYDDDDDDDDNELVLGLCLFLKSFNFCCLSEYNTDSFLFSGFVDSEWECECLIVLLYNRNVGFLPCFKHPYGLSSVNLIGEKVGVYVDKVVEGMDKGEGECEGEGEGEGEGECEGEGEGEDTNVSMMGAGS